MTNTLLGIFSNRINAERAIAELEKNGFNPRDISLIMRDQQTGQTVTHQGTNLAEGAVSGAATGGVLGALAGLLVGVGAIAIPGVGALLVAGPLAAALGLTGVAAATVSGAVTGVVAGGLVGGLIGLGIPEEEAKVIEGRIREGGILLAVPVLLEEEARVRKIFADFGADMVRVISSGEREREMYNQNYQAYEPKISLPEENESPMSAVEDNQAGKSLNNTFNSPQNYNPDNPVYYSDVKRRPNYDRNLNDLAARRDNRSFWEKLKDLFR